MNKEIIIWISKCLRINYFHAKILYLFSHDNMYYSNLVEGLINFLNFINVTCIICKTSDLPADIFNSESETVNNFLCYNTNGNEIISDSCKYINEIKKIKKYDYVILIEDIKYLNLSPEIYIEFARKNIFKILISAAALMTLVLFNSLVNLSYIYLNLFAVYLLLENNSSKDKSKLIKGVCSVGRNENTCEKLQEAEGKIFNYFNFSDLGIVTLLTFSYIFLFETLMSGSQVFILLILIIFLIIGLFYSIFSQFKHKIFCNICLLTDLVIGLDIVFLVFYLNKMNYYFSYDSLVSLLVFFFILLTLMITVINEKSNFNLKRSLFVEQHNFKQLFLSNFFNIRNNFEKVVFEITEFNKVAFTNNNNQNYDMFVIISFDCPSCIELIKKLKILATETNINLKLFCHIKNFESSTEFVKYCSLLAYIFEKHGLIEFVNATLKYNYKYTKLQLIKKEYDFRDDISFDQDFIRITDMLRLQNVFIKKWNITNFPFVFSDSFRIPEFIDPKYYPLLIKYRINE